MQKFSTKITIFEFSEKFRYSKSYRIFFSKFCSKKNCKSYNEFCSNKKFPVRDPPPWLQIFLQLGFRILQLGWYFAVRIQDDILQTKICSQGSPSLTAKNFFAVRVPPPWLKKKKKLQSGCRLPDCKILNPNVLNSLLYVLEIFKTKY